MSSWVLVAARAQFGTLRFNGALNDPYQSAFECHPSLMTDSPIRVTSALGLFHLRIGLARLVEPIRLGDMENQDLLSLVRLSVQTRSKSFEPARTWPWPALCRMGLNDYLEWTNDILLLQTQRIKSKWNKRTVFHTWTRRELARQSAPALVLEMAHVTTDCKNRRKSQEDAPLQWRFGAELSTLGKVAHQSQKMGPEQSEPSLYSSKKVMCIKEFIFFVGREVDGGTKEAFSFRVCWNRASLRLLLTAASRELSCCSGRS